MGTGQDERGPGHVRVRRFLQAEDLDFAVEPFGFLFAHGHELERITHDEIGDVLVPAIWPASAALSIRAAMTTAAPMTSPSAISRTCPAWIPARIVMPRWRVGHAIGLLLSASRPDRRPGFLPSSGRIRSRDFGSPISGCRHRGGGSPGSGCRPPLPEGRDASDRAEQVIRSRSAEMSIRLLLAT